MGRKTKLVYRQGYEDLANAIITQAANDYRKVYKRYKRGDDRAKMYVEALEKFFNSKRADLYSHGKAKYILKRLQAEYKEKPPKKTVKISKVEVNMSEIREKRNDCMNCKHIVECDLSKQAFYKFAEKQCEEWEKE